MTDNLYQNLHAGGLISDESLERIKLKQQQAPLFSVHWEVRTLLYIGVLMLTGGLGILIYENIDTIGHQFVLAFIALICGGSFVYCFKHKAPFSMGKVKAPNSFFDYILLLGCISMLIFLGYLQYQYKVFGSNYGLATFIPMLVLFYVAYVFDHLGILSMAIANLAVWMGVSVTPQRLLFNNDFDNATIAYTYLVLGALLLAAAIVTRRLVFKPHFKFSYQHYGVHVTYIALLATYFNHYDSGVAVLAMVGIAALSYFTYRDAFKQQSFYFLLLVVLYGYIAFSSLAMRVLMAIPQGGGIELAFLYFIASGVGFILLLIHLNKKIKTA